MRIVRRQKKIKVFPVARQQVFKLPVRFQYRRQPQRAHPHPDTANNPQPLTPALYPLIHALQLHQCLMEAISNRQSSDHRSSKQDDFSEDEGDTVIASALTAALHERSTTTESPVANTESCSKGDATSSEMADPSSPPLIPTTLHTPAGFKTQALLPPRLVRLPHRSTSRAEQCEVASHRRLHSVPMEIERAVQVFPRVPQVRADLVAQSPHAQGLVGHSHSIAKCADTRKTTHVHDQFPLPQFIMFLLRTFPQSAASARGFRFANPTQQQYQRAPSRTGVLHRASRDHSRWSVLPDRQIALQVRASFLVQRGSRSSLQRAGTEDVTSVGCDT